MKITVTLENVSLDELRQISEKLSGETITVVSPSAFVSENEDAPSTADVSGEVDADGHAWDANLHSSSKKKTASGHWVKRRGAAASTATAAPVLPPVTPTAAPVLPTAQDFPSLLTRVQQGVASAKVGKDHMAHMVASINQALSINATSIVDFANNPTALQIAHNYLTQLGA